MKSFQDHLERWRNEPETRRQRRALFIAFSFTVCLFILWLASFRLSTLLRATPTVEATASPGIIERIKVGWQTIIK
ncbi:MAG: hypothetical protein V1704_00885 [Candidatus Vogelbacteria bacterium]